MTAVIAIIQALIRLAPWVGVTFFTWKLEKAGAVDAVARDVQKAAQGGGQVLDMVNKGSSSGLVLLGIGILAIVLIAGRK